MLSKMILRKRNLNVNGFDGGGGNKNNGVLKRKNTVSVILKPVEQLPEVDQLPDAMEESKTNLEISDDDFDRKTKHDVTALATYAKDIFDYYQYRERFFKVGNYFDGKQSFDQDSRAMVINWLVEMQETFEFNHETLYLTVKLFDIYMDRVPNVPLNGLQLILCASAFIASKFDERTPPLIDDFVYIGAGAFGGEDLVVMERELFNAVGLDLGAPVSYRFLRRYSRVAKTDMQTLTLARYILETSLMFFDFCRVSESLMAAGSYLLALRMKNIGDWSFLLEKHSGFKKEQVEPLASALNHMIIKRKVHYKHLDVIYAKYCHEIFFGVGLIDSLPDEIASSEPMMPPSDLLA